MLTGTSTESAAAFIASYHRPPAVMLPRPRRSRVVVTPPAGPHTRERYAWFRIEVLRACRTWTRGTAALLERSGIDRDSSAGRVAWRNLALMVRREFLFRGDDGYRTTARGLRALADLRALGLDTAERAA